MKKNIYLTIIAILFLLIFIYLSYIIFNKYELKTSIEKEVLNFSEKNDNIVFNIEKLTFFSSSNSDQNTSSRNHFTIQNLYQYTDIAFFINSTTEEKTARNTLKSVYIDNIVFDSPSLIGTQNLFFKSVHSFTKNEIIEENLIADKLEFQITSNDSDPLSSPILYNNLANPITLSYINQNLKTDYTFTDTSIPITYDGSLLKRCNITLNSLQTNFSFDVHITNNLDEEFITTVYVDIPLKSSDDDIYSGKVNLEENVHFDFLMI